MKWFRDQLVMNAHKFDFPIHTPYYALTDAQKRLLWLGNEYFEGLNSFFDMLDRVTHYEMDADIMILLSNGTLVGMMKALPADTEPSYLPL